MAAPKALGVAVRCRPVLPHDRDQRVCVQVHGDRDVECLDPEHLHAELRAVNGRPDYLKENHCRERSYRFDAVFGPGASNEELFRRLVKPLVPQVAAGRHATCFAYGQTGSGKTHTMLGRQGETGLVERTLLELLGGLPGEATVSATFVEVYNERIRDLLREDCPALDLREDPLRGPCIAGVSEVATRTAERVMQLVRTGNERRTEERTAANPVSSRSHAVLQLHVETPLAPQKKGIKRSRFARLSLVDLAGSERAANTGNSGARLREGAMINRSLLALANCITALSRKGAYVNYRDSKLTRLLKDSLSGNCHTVMIAHVSPSISSFEETLNTLKYAHRACEIRGMGGGVRENVCVAAAQYAERLRQTCVDATRGIGRTLAQLALPRPSAAKASVEPPAPAAPAAAAELPAVIEADAAEAEEAADRGKEGKAVALADALQRSKHAVASKMRERVRLGQTALELEDQNEANAVELSKLELGALCGAEAQRSVREAHEAISVQMHRNEAQRQKVAQAAARAEGSAKDRAGEERLVELLRRTKASLEAAAGGGEEELGGLERRLLHAQHANALLELEKVEAEQANVLLEAAARRHELALRKQALQLDIHRRALAAAEALIARRGLAEDWRAELGPLASVLPGHAQAPNPSVDDLLAELDAPAPAKSPAPAPRPPALGAAPEEESSAGGAQELAKVEEGFVEVMQLLGKSARLARTYPSDYASGPPSSSDPGSGGSGSEPEEAAPAAGGKGGGPRTPRRTPQRAAWRGA